MILQNLQNSQSKRIALLIRHADRNKIPEGSFGDEIQLNTRGKQNAFNFGEQLKDFQINKIYTSPVMRCVQTAQRIVKGYKLDVEIQESTLLGEPGAFISDQQKAGDFFLKYGMDRFYGDFVSEIKIPGVRAKEGQDMIYNFMKLNTLKDGLTIFVSHDILIAGFDYYFSATIYSKENWIPFLGGIVLEFY